MRRFFWLALHHSVIWAAFVGVPLAVLFLSGGPGTIWFWIETLVVVAVGLFAGMMWLWLPGLLVLPVLSAILKKVTRGRSERFTDAVTAGFWTVGSLVVFILRGPPLGDGANLPTSSPRLGALLMIFGAGGDFVVLIWLRGVLEKKNPYPTRPPRRAWVPPVRVEDPGELDEPQEYWSPEPILAWRMWGWNGDALMGFWAPWVTARLDAECNVCSEPPGWSHSCGIYSVKDPVHLDVYAHFPVRVVGQVELRGLVVEHEDGYRAQGARIVRLWVEDRQTAVALTRRYPDVQVLVGVAPASEGIVT